MLLKQYEFQRIIRNDMIRNDMIRRRRRAVNLEASIGQMHAYTSETFVPSNDLSCVLGE